MKEFIIAAVVMVCLFSFSRGFINALDKDIERLAKAQAVECAKAQTHLDVLKEASK